MKITILNKENEAEEDEIIVKCGKIDSRMMNVLNSLKNGEAASAAVEATERKKLTFYKDGKIVLVNQDDVFYFESVEDKTFAYTADQVFETKSRIYQLEEMLPARDFFRASKAVIVNLNRIQSLSPAFGGRFEAVLENGYKVIISRMYVAGLKKVLGI